MIVKIYITVLLILLLSFASGFTVYGLVTMDEQREGRVIFGICTFLISAILAIYLVCRGVAL